MKLEKKFHVAICVLVNNIHASIGNCIILVDSLFNILIVKTKVLEIITHLIALETISN